MKTSPRALRDLADYTGKRDDPDTTTALRWAADDIEHMTEAIGFIKDLADEIAPSLRSVPAGELLCRHIVRKVNELHASIPPTSDAVLVLRVGKYAPDRAEQAEAALDDLATRLDALAVELPPTQAPEVLRAWHDWDIQKPTPPPIDFLAIATEIEQLWRHNRTLLAALGVKVDVIARLINKASTNART